MLPKRWIASECMAAGMKRTNGGRICFLKQGLVVVPVVIRPRPWARPVSPLGGLYDK